MNLGEIYAWDSDQAAGHAKRRKYHVYLCEGGWRVQGHAFLFVSSADYGGDYRIDKTDYAFLTKEYSFISCGNIVTYADSDLNSANPEFLGKISISDLQGLYHAIARSDTMEQWQIRLCCDALKGTL